MKTDALDRRKRTSPSPTGKNPELKGGVLDLLQGLRRYHPLPPKVAFGFCTGVNYYPYFQDKLTDLTHERPDGEEPVIVRPEYFNPEGVLNSEPVWYDLSDRGRRIALSEALHPLEIPERDHIKHRAFNACVGASFELLAPAYNMKHLHIEDIMADARCPATTRKLKNPLRLPLPFGKHIEADRLLGFQFAGGADFYGVEIDRATETNVRTVFEKLDNWLTVFETRAFKEFWGLPNLRIMFITTAPGRITSYLEYLKDKSRAERFLFKALPNFGVHWKAPRQPIAELFEPWQTTNGPFDITRT